jgi:hypothetical protein
MPAAGCGAFDRFLTDATAPLEATGGAVNISTATVPVACTAPQFIDYVSPYPTGSTGAAVAIDRTALELWIKPTLPATSGTVVEQRGAFQLSIDNAGGSGHWRFDIGGNISLSSTGPGDFAADQWQHVVASFGFDGARLFVNGRLVESEKLLRRRNRRRQVHFESAADSARAVRRLVALVARWASCVCTGNSGSRRRE